MTLDYGASSVTMGASVLTVRFAITPTYRNSGKSHNLYMRLVTASGAYGWNDRGDWAINRTPMLVSPDAINSTVPSGQRLTLNPRYYDADGLNNLKTMYLAIANALPTGEFGSGAIYLKYEQAQDRLYLANSAGTAWIPRATPGTPGAFLENDAVQVILQYSSAGAADARTQLVRWRLEFDPSFAGFHRVYMRAVDDLGADTGWKLKAR